MRKHPVRKLLGLTVLYAAIIIGIFVLQFKTESVVSRTIGQLHIMLAQTQTDANTVHLRNSIQVSFKGLNFTANDEFPATVYRAAAPEEAQQLVLASWSEPDALSVQFDFIDGSAIVFALSDETEDAQLSITAIPSEEFDTLSLAYKTAGNYSIKELAANHAIISSKESDLALQAYAVSEDRIVFSAADSVALYARYDPAQRFDYNLVAGLPHTDLHSYEQLVQLMRGTLVERFNAARTTAEAANFSEQDVIAYVAEMAKNGRYGEALDAVPAAFKRGNRRTYLSAPYFDSLSSMNHSLIMQTEKFRSLADSSITSKDLNIFTVDGIADFMLREKYTSRVRSMAAIPLQQATFAPTLAQATALIAMYNALSPKDPVLAQSFADVLPECLDVIANGCTLENQQLTLSENESPCSTIQTIETGVALLTLGSIKNEQELVQTGCLLVASALPSVSGLDLHSLSELYPLMVTDNAYYPHTVVLGYYGTTPVWAWTCASAITYVQGSSGVIDMNIEFPLGLTHHLILTGVPSFHSNIEIQRQRFRTDPRFETYNSSGYVYQGNTETLLLKSRHKTSVELIRLFCDPAPNFIRADVLSEPIPGTGTSTPAAQNRAAQGSNQTADRNPSPAPAGAELPVAEPPNTSAAPASAARNNATASEKENSNRQTQTTPAASSATRPAAETSAPAAAQAAKTAPTAGTTNKTDSSDSQEQTAPQTVDVVLESIDGRRRTEAIRAISGITRKSESEVRAMLNNPSNPLPITVLTQVPPAEAEQVVTKLKNAGAQARIR